MSVFQQFIQRRRSLRWLWMRMYRYQQLLLASSLLLLVVVLHTSLFYWFEHAKNAKITLFDSLWVTLTTITTVGYGDLSASTVGGRLSTIVLGYATGLSLFAWVGSEVISRLLEKMMNRRRGMVKKTRLDGHYLIVNYPGHEKVRLLIERLRKSETTALKPLVIVTDSIEELPFDYSQVRFVRGSVTNPATYKRANIDQAACAIVLANDHEDPSSDAITAAAVSIIESMNPKIQTVAECVFEEHLTLFRHVKCDHIVLAGDMLIKLLVQETEDDSAAKAIARLLDPTGNEFYSVQVGEKASGHSFREILWELLARNEMVLPVGYQRGDDIRLNPPREDKLQAEDTLIFLADNRPHWDELPSDLF
jgi:voltage-gated potassium channel